MTDSDQWKRATERAIKVGVQEGDVLAAKYRVERVLGEGGMGVVVAARHLQLDERVAIKFLLPRALENPQAVDRFLREAKAAVKIKSEHVARVTDVGTLENGAPYIVMEYLEGGDLHAWLEQRGPLPVDQAVEFILQASVAVAEAHGLGIVHRDLKPANLFCTRRSDGVLSVKVLDFGVSKLMERTPSSADIALTKTGVTVGTPLYMAPEQMRSSRTVDARADIWALGVILYELLGGACPFMADSVMDLSIKIYNDPPLPLRELRPEVPPALEAVILRCLEKQPAQRYPNVGELATALLPFAPARAKASVERISGIVEASGQPSAPALPSPPQRDESTGPGTLPAVGRTTPGRAPGKAWVIGAGFFAGIVVAGVAAFVLRPQGAPAHEAAVVASGPAIAVAATASASASATPVVAPDPALASASAAPPPSAAPTQRAPASAPRAAALPTARPPAVSCDPPTFTDSNGHVHLKPGCQ